MSLLDVQNLRVRFPTRHGVFEAVRGVSFDLGQERLGIVGESGAGKTMTCRAILRLIQKPGLVEADHICYQGTNLPDLTEAAMCKIRGREISMVMQDPQFSLNPVMPVGKQMLETYILHNRSQRKLAHNKIAELLQSVAIRDPERVMRAYPHELSGGIGQRVMIAMMLIPDPQILIADEPTSALDVSAQGQVLNIMDRLVRDRGMGLIFISHDLNLVSRFCDRVLIMYAGRIVEVCDAAQLHKARHPYTRGLLTSLPSLEHPGQRLQVLQRDPAWSEAPGISGVRQHA